VQASAFPQEPLRISASSTDRQGEHPDARALERALVERAKAGDDDAFEQLYRSHVQGVARHVRLRLGSVDEDVVAEVFLRAWQGLANHRDMGRPFGAWLYGIARNVIVDELRTRGRTVAVADVPDRGVEPMTAELLALREAIDGLPDDQRQVVRLKYLAGLTNDEVATALETTVGAVNTRRWRALRALAGLLEDGS
jgi:RNA polymerase sigma-70 factor, ECF subfamily